MTDNTTPGPLQADPSRQAHRSIAGYEYQILQTVYAWLLLRDDEWLYVEGAEDLDRVAGASADTMQVKHLARNVTLASEETLESITHFWENQERNQSRSIQLHFITNAVAGLERDRPFGDEPGLRAWEAAKRPGVDLGPLRAFLGSQQRLPDAIRLFVQEASDADLRDRLIGRVSWQTAGLSRADLRSIIEQEIATQASSQFQVIPSDAISAVPLLIDAAFQAASSGDRKPLTRGGLLLLLEERFTERIAAPELRQLRSASLALVSILTQGGGSDLPAIGIGLALLEPVDARVTPGFVRREPLVADLTSRLASTGLVLLKGSAGMGKSTLARLVAGRVGGVWARLDLRGRPPADLTRLLVLAATLLPRSAAGAGLIIDDLTVEHSSIAHENALIRLLQLCKERHLNVLLTSHVDLPVRVSSELGMETTYAATIGPLSEEDLRELAENYGCPPGASALRWARVIQATTQGHPQLAHARVLHLRQDEWPQSEEALVESLTAKADLALVQTQARQRLREELPSEHARGLVYRLTVFTTYFSKAQAIALIDAANPGELFESLIGPWIEGPVEGGYYRVSPLLKGSAEETLGQSGVNEVRRRICDVIVRQRTLSSIDFAELVLQAFVSRYDYALGRAAIASMQIPRELSQEILGNLVWLPLARTGEEDVLFPENRRTSVLLRHLQFSVAQASHSADLPRLVDAWDRELRALMRDDKGSVLPRLQFLFKVLTSRDIDLPAETVLRFGNELLSLAVSHQELFPASLLRDEHKPSIGLRGIVVDMLILRTRGPQGTAALLEVLDRMPSNEREMIEEELRGDSGHAVELMMSLFATSPPTLPNRETVTAAIQLAIKLGGSRRIPALATAARRAQAVIEHEYNQDSAAALACLDGAVGDEKSDAILEEYRARILFSLGRIDESLRIWLDVLPHWQGAPWTRVFSLRDAAVAASRLGQYRTAAALFADGAVAARGLNVPHLAAGLACEAALAMWRNGARQMAISRFADALSEIEKLPDASVSLESLILHKLVSHSILWLLRETRGTDFAGDVSIAEPPPGRLSNLQPDEEFRALPLAPLSESWALLAAVQIENDAGSDILDLVQRRWPTVLMADLQIAMATLRQRLRKRDLDGLVGLGRQLFKVFSQIRGRQIDKPAEAPAVPETEAAAGSDDFVVGLLAMAIAVSSADRPLQDLPVQRWRSDAPNVTGDGAGIVRLCDHVSELLRDDRSALALTKDEMAPAQSRLAAAVFLTVSPGTPDELFLATATLVTGYAGTLWRRDVEKAIEVLVSRGWRDMVRHHRFALRSPALVVPAVEAACEDGSVAGLTKCARIVLAAHLGTSVRVAPEALESLRRLAAA